MQSGSSSSLSARAQRTKRTKRNTGSKRVQPLYKRLPHGPHRLERNEVILNQRSRIFGAMIEAVGTDGYEGTIVKQTIALAGVSRRSFYEMFANKEECFLAAFDMLARRDVKQIRNAYPPSDGDLEERLGAALRRFAQMARRGSQGDGAGGARGASAPGRSACCGCAARSRSANSC